ncbi:SDR family oxidoreductase [Aquimarina addita]|uniref:SDR family oxidoreductase n=1 Tax=Aquimarina addita TaxID=870485 RepID=A0ABP7XCA0_9FLAO
MNIILTGVTGTLGSKVLHELLEQKADSLETIYVLVRKKQRLTPQKRIDNMLASDATPDFIKNNLSAFQHKIQVIDAIYMLDPAFFLKKNQDNYFIHSAGYVNLSLDPNHKKEIFEENFELTKSIFKKYSEYIRKFIYISTAFSIGEVTGQIDNDYLSSGSGKYRNNYEASKHASEHFLREEANKKGIALQILRPSVLGGNIFDTKFFISKYMVFYLFAKFFYATKSNDTIRIQAGEKVGLNIIPVDYAAKVIVKVFESDIEQLNIVHSKTTPMVSGIKKILDTVGFTNFSITEDMISEAVTFESKLEKFYYQTIGIHLSPYFNSQPHEWDTTLLEKILPIPAYDLEDYLVGAIEYATTNDFKNQRW